MTLKEKYALANEGERKRRWRIAAITGTQHRLRQAGAALAECVKMFNSIDKRDVSRLDVSEFAAMGKRLDTLGAKLETRKHELETQGAANRPKGADGADVDMTMDKAELQEVAERAKRALAARAAKPLELEKSEAEKHGTAN